MNLAEVINTLLALGCRVSFEVDRDNGKVTCQVSSRMSLGEGAGRKAEEALKNALDECLHSAKERGSILRADVAMLDECSVCLEMRPS